MTNVPSTSAINFSSTKNEDSSSNQPSRTEVTKFFEKLLNKNNNAPTNPNPDEQRRNAAQFDLMRHTTLQASINKSQNPK